MSLEDKVKSVLEEIRPRLQMDGGDIAFIELDAENRVKVSLRGACAGCPGATFTLKMGAERIIKERIPEIKEVINV